MALSDLPGDGAERYDLNPFGGQPTWPESLPSHKSNDQTQWPEANPWGRFNYEP